MLLIFMSLGRLHLIEDFTISAYTDNDTVVSSYYTGLYQIKLVFEPVTGKLLIQSATADPVYFDIRTLASFKSPTVNKNYNLQKEDNLSLRIENNYLAAKIIFHEIQGTHYRDSLHIKLIKADLLIKFKKSGGEK